MLSMNEPESLSLRESPSQSPAPTRIDFSSTGDVNVAAYRWDPVGEPRAIAQVVHGVGEYALRYTPLVEALVARGFVVYSHDHRGHGATLVEGHEPGLVGEDGWQEIVADVGRVIQTSRAAHPSLKHVLIAHSLGSYASQQYLLDHSSEVDAFAMTGTAALDLLEPALDLDGPLDLAIFNAGFVPARTDFDWLSRDNAQVDAYISDPLCGFGLDIAGNKALFVGARRLADNAQVSAMRADLPIYVAVGEKDPVNGEVALAHALIDRYVKAGLTDVTLKVWEDARHEIYNETNRDEVFAELFAWIDNRLG